MDIVEQPQEPNSDNLSYEAPPIVEEDTALRFVDNDLRLGDATLITCMRCSQENVPASPGSPRICLSCDKALTKRYALERTQNDGWQELAAQMGLELWERQPSETSTEWMIWQKYCSYYPGRVPPNSRIAEELGVSHSMVTQASQRWNYKVRILSWSHYSDALTVQARVTAVKTMHERHISMAQKLNDKLDQAIDQLQPSLMKPSEIASLLKVSSELEKKAQLHQDEKVSQGESTGGPKHDKVTKTEDVQEVLKTLEGLGLLPGVTQGVGIKTITTTETQLVVKGTGPSDEEVYSYGDEEAYDCDDE